MKFSELTPGKIYSLYSTRFDATNICRMICFDTTEMNRPISYWQFADRDLPILTEAKLRQLFDKGVSPSGVFAMWDWEFTMGSYEIKEVASHLKANDKTSPIQDKAQLFLFDHQ